MPLDDLSQHITSEYDFYDILGVEFETSEADIRRAYRRTALKYHPDKNVGNAAAVEKFHLLQIAYDVLTDPAVKAAYDGARAARLAKRRQKELFDGKRRQMMDDLERRERGVKRGRDEEVDAEERLRREVARLAEDGKRRRKEREELLRREKLEEEEEKDRRLRAEQEAATAAADGKAPNGTASVQDSGVSEMDRTIKVRWARQGPGQSIDKESLTTMFSKFGKVDSAFLLKDKKRKGDRDGHDNKKTKKMMMATGVIQYSSIVGAHAAVEDFPMQRSPEWEVFDSVQWASNKEPDFTFASSSSTAASSPEAPPPQPPPPSSSSSTTTPNPFSSRPIPFPGLAAASSQEDGIRRVPSFASFGSRTINSPRGTDTTSNQASTPSPSLEEITMIRLKQAEKHKRRLEDEIRRGEADEERREKLEQPPRNGGDGMGETVPPV